MHVPYSVSVAPLIATAGLHFTQRRVKLTSETFHSERSRTPHDGACSRKRCRSDQQLHTEWLTPTLMPHVPSSSVRGPFLRISEVQRVLLAHIRSRSSSVVRTSPRMPAVMIARKAPSQFGICAAVIKAFGHTPVPIPPGSQMLRTPRRVDRPSVPPRHVSYSSMMGRTAGRRGAQSRQSVKKLGNSKSPSQAGSATYSRSRTLPQTQPFARPSTSKPHLGR